MDRAPILATLLVCLLIAVPVSAEEPTYDGGTLLHKTARVLRKRLPSQAEHVDRLVGTLAEEAEACTSEADERHVVFRLLEQIPTSHLCLLSGFGYRTASADLGGRDHVTLGLWLVEIDGRYFADHVLWEGPAHEAGIRRGDEVTAIDGVATRDSPHLDFRTDDAYLPDPPTHFVRCRKNVAITFSVKTREDQAELVDVVVMPAYTSTVAADRAGVRTVMRKGVPAGYVSIRLMTYRHAGEHLRDALEGPLADQDAVLVDIRGRGGSPADVWACLAHLRAAKQRGVELYILTDRRTRSAKEILAQQAKAAGLATLVGEPTAGAVRRSRFLRVGDDTWLLCPVFGLEETTFSAELVGVTPDIPCADALPWAHGRDPIVVAALEAVIRARMAVR